MDPSNQLKHGLSGDSEDRSSASKKVRTEDVEPSKVVHLRGLPPDCTEIELKSLVVPPLPNFISQVLLLRGKGQGFIEFSSVQHASQMIEMYKTVPAYVRGRHVFLQFSNRHELEVPKNSADTGANTTGILHVTIQDCIYPVTIEILYSIFQCYGSILRIIIFSKKEQVNSPVVNSLIQYSEPVSANSAKTALNGKNLYEGSSFLKIQNSTLEKLEVEYNNEKSWDFTRNLPSGPSNKPTNFISAKPITTFGYHPPTTSMAFGGMVGDISQSSNSVLIVSNLAEGRISPDGLFNLFGAYGDVIRVKILFNKRNTALIQMSNPQQAAIAVKMLDGLVIFEKKLSVNFSTKATITLPRAGAEDDSTQFNKDYTNSEFHRFKILGSKNYHNICPPCVTLHISNISGTTEEDLKKEFSKYGTVVNFRFFQNSNKMALIQMSSISEAAEALISLHLHPISPSSSLRVAFSKNSV